MKQKILIGLIALFSVMGLVSAVAQPAMANGFGDEINKGLEQVGGKQTASANDVIKTIINALLFFIGVVAVIMIIWAGIQYTTSAGDSNKVATAKNTIVYAVIGLIVAIFAYAIVNFVVSTFNTGGGGGNSGNTTNTSNTSNNNSSNSGTTTGNGLNNSGSFRSGDNGKNGSSKVDRGGHSPTTSGKY
jgi:trbC/VIRB2 family